MGVRVALGASRHRLFQMLLVESLLLALASGAVGLLIANWVLRAVPAVLTASLPGVSDVSLDIRVVSFTMGLSIVTALFFGLVPMIAGMKRELTDALREGARSAGGRRQHRLQGGLVVASVALAFVLLVASGLLIRSFNNLMNAESGINALNVLSVEVSLAVCGLQPGAARAIVLSNGARADHGDSRRQVRRRHHGSCRCARMANAARSRQKAPIRRAASRRASR